MFFRSFGISAMRKLRNADKNLQQQLHMEIMGELLGTVAPVANYFGDILVDPLGG